MYWTAVWRWPVHSRRRETWTPQEKQMSRTHQQIIQRGGIKRSPLAEGQKGMPSFYAFLDWLVYPKNHCSRRCKIPQILILHVLPIAILCGMCRKNTDIYQQTFCQTTDISLFKKIKKESFIIKDMTYFCIATTVQIKSTKSIYLLQSI